MPYIKASEIEKLIEVENYLGEKESWSENTCKLWDVIETLLNRQNKVNKKAKEYMRGKRKENPQYGRSKKC